MTTELHGDKGPSVSSYVYRKCHCQDCRDAWAAYQRDRYAKRKERES